MLKRQTTKTISNLDKLNDVVNCIRNLYKYERWHVFCVVLGTHIILCQSYKFTTFFFRRKKLILDIHLESKEMVTYQDDKEKSPMTKSSSVHNIPNSCDK